MMMIEAIKLSINAKQNLILFLTLSIATSTYEASLTNKTAEASGSFRCYNSVNFKAFGISIINQKSEQICSIPQSSCITLKASVTVTIIDGVETKGEVEYGDCYPTNACFTISCESLINSVEMLRGLRYYFSVNTCERQCCHKNFCNNNMKTYDENLPSTEQLNTLQLQQQLSTIATPGDSRVGCRVGVEYSIGRLKQDRRTLVKCSVGLTCSKISTEIHAYFAGIPVFVELLVDECVTTPVCKERKCEDINHYLPFDSPPELKGCKAECCENTRDCIGQSAKLGPSVKNDKGPECHVGVKYTGEVHVDSMNMTFCDRGSSCSKISARTSNTFAGVSIFFEAILVQCKSASACRIQDCEDLRSYIPSQYLDHFDGCSVECCGMNGGCTASSHEL